MRTTEGDPGGAALSARVRLEEGGSGVPIDPKIYGQYLEHLEDCIYPALQRDGVLRTDVIDEARRLGVPAVRWPGGCFADLYHWQDGVGTPEGRPVRRNFHWGGLESNRFGTDEFLRWCEQVGAEAYVNVNLGTGTLDEALRWLDYCNGTEPTTDVLERRRNGRETPWNVRIWGIGNETWGDWEAGHTDAESYASTLANWARFFAQYDPDLRLVGVGSSAARDAHWDETVLRKAGRLLDYLSLHVYGAVSTEPDEAEAASVVCTPRYIEHRIALMGNRLREYNRRHPDQRPVRLAMDEWNIRHYERLPDGTSVLRRADPRTYVDALFAAGVFHAMLRNADIVGMANYVFLVNGNGVIDARGDTARATTLATVFAYYRAHLSGSVVPLSVDSPEIPMPAVGIEHSGAQPEPESVPPTIEAIDAVAARADDGAVTIALLNRHPDHPVRLNLTAARPSEPAEPTVERLVDLGATATVEPVTDADLADLELPPHSLTFVRGARRAENRMSPR